GPGELLVEIKATALNPVDWKIQSSGYFLTDYPAIWGPMLLRRQGSRRRCDRIAVGDKVVFHHPKATFQQYSIVPAEITAKIPSNISFEQASTVPLVLATAAFGLYSKKVAPPGREGGRGKYSGQPILVIGGSSADTSLTFCADSKVLQLAKLSGFSPIITTASSHNASFVKSLGATHVIDRNTPLVSAVKAITSDPIKVVYDAISEKATQDEAYEVLAPGGSFILVLPFAIEESKVDNTKEVVQVFGSVHDPNQRATRRQLVQEFDRVAREREVKPNNVEIVPNGLAGIPDALEKLKSGKVSATKLVAQP
ncbi:GroES-like protein, partial [Cytidiella melzeri]